MNPLDLGVIGQPNRIAPVVQDERMCAIHESAHAVFHQIFENTNAHGRISMNEGDNGNWEGIVTRNTPLPDGAYAGFPDLASTQPYYWQQHCRRAWSILLCCFAGAAAELIHDGYPLGADSIISHPFASADASHATDVCRHFWPEAHQQTILNLAAETAGQLCQTPAIWAAINALADFLLVDARHKASIYETSVIVRRYITQNIEAPHADLAVSLARKA